jgi:group I intron endonuclease
MKRSFKTDPGIYLITNTCNGKVWVGQGQGKKGVQGRVTGHLTKFKRGINSSHLQSAWNKYGSKAFVFEVILYCSAEQCDFWEDYYIELFQSWKKEWGYNLDRFARGTGPRTKATIEKISLGNLPHRARVMRLLNSPESRAKAVISRKETCDDPEWRKMFSSKMQEVYKDPEKREQRKQKAKEVQNRPEVKDKLHKAKSGRVWCNNGVENRFVKPEDVPSDWILGGLIDHGTCRGRKYFTNPNTGEVKRLAVAPDGWVLGRGLRVNS